MPEVLSEAELSQLDSRITRAECGGRVAREEGLDVVKLTSREARMLLEELKQLRQQADFNVIDEY